MCGTSAKKQRFSIFLNDKHSTYTFSFGLQLGDRLYIILSKLRSLDKHIILISLYNSMVSVLS